jgi:alpha/beta hydrolase family protein
VAELGSWRPSASLTRRTQNSRAVESLVIRRTECSRFDAALRGNGSRAAGEWRSAALAERYSSKADYVSKVQAAAQALVDERLLLQEDVARYVQSAQTQTLLQ